MASKSHPAANAEKPAVFLLDAMSFIFRAYHAMQRQRPMSTRNGIPTAAAYVFINMLNKLRRDFQPVYFAAVFDVTGPVFRDERAKEFGTIRKWNAKAQTFEVVAYAGYKSNRSEMPPDLAQQLPYIRRALEAFHIPILESEGFEADDVLGTLACKAAAEGHPIFVVSNDKDMMQLVTEEVKILNPVKDNLILDRQGVIDTLGVPPERVIDVMALRGDSIDNIPGAPGIGDKGSVELIQQFGSLEGVLDHIAEIKRKTYRESLENNQETVRLSKELVTIDCNVPVLLDLDGMRMRPPDLPACRALFNELEFTSLLKELAPEEEASLEVLASPGVEQLNHFVKLARGTKFGLAVDLSPIEAIAEQTAEQESEASEEKPPETLSLLDLATQTQQEIATTTDTSFGLRVAISTEQGKALVLHLDPGTEGAALRSLIEDEGTEKLVHDLKGVLRAIERNSAQTDVQVNGPVDDLMLYSYLINPTHATHRLADVAARFGRPLRESAEDPLPEAANAIRALAPVLKAEVESGGTAKVYREIDLPLVPVLLRMEQVGVRIDRDVLSEMSRKLGANMDRVSQEIFDRSGHRFNINSPKQLGDVIFNKMQLPKPLKYGRGKVVSTAVEVLEELAKQNEVPRLVLEYRQLAKLKSNYADSLPLLADQEGRVHTTFNQVGTATGRLSSNNPNLQNIPIRTALGRQIRAAFIAPPNHVLLSADYSQIELRLLAHLSADPLLTKVFTEAGDIHTLTASEVFGIPLEKLDKQTRDRAKAVNFGIVYGISPFGLSQQLGIEQNEARLYIETYFARYQGVRVYIDQVLEETRRDQRVRTLFGRSRPIPDIQSRNANQRGFAERTAVNTPLQGTAADMIKIAMIRIDRLLREKKWKTRMTLQVHDELVFDVPEDEIDQVKKLVKHEMENVIELKVPVVADCGIGSNWRDLE